MGRFTRCAATLLICITAGVGVAPGTSCGADGTGSNVEASRVLDDAEVVMADAVAAAQLGADVHVSLWEPSAGPFGRDGEAVFDLYAVTEEPPASFDAERVADALVDDHGFVRTAADDDDNTLTLASPTLTVAVSTTEWVADGGRAWISMQSETFPVEVVEDVLAGR